MDPKNYHTASEDPIKDGFAVLRPRWIVERTFAWGNGQRRLSKDYEKSVPVSEAMIHISASARNLIPIF